MREELKIEVAKWDTDRLNKILEADNTDTINRKDILAGIKHNKIKIRIYEDILTQSRLKAENMLKFQKERKRFAHLLYQ